MTLLLWILALLCIVMGLIGIVVPALPGILLVFVGLVLAAWAEDFDKVGWLPLVSIALLASVSIGADILATKIGVEKSGASKAAAWGAAIGALVGLFFAPWGLVFGPFLGAVCAELLVRREAKQAIKAGFGAWLGLLLSYAMKYVIAFCMIAMFILAYLW